MGRDNISLGKKGENIAEAFLIKNRYKILERNLRTPFGEIDIIALDKDTLVFVEVKTRTSESFGPPHQSITYFKQQSIIRNAHYYLKRKKLYDMNIRLDIISINLNDKDRVTKLNHIKSAIWDN